MTKSQIGRLVSLAREMGRGIEENRDEYCALWDEFEAWQPVTPDQLPALLIEAEAVGYLHREWRASEEQWEELKRHPYYRPEADAAKQVYETERAALWAKAGLPVPDDDP